MGKQDILLLSAARGCARIYFTRCTMSRDEELKDSEI